MLKPLFCRAIAYLEALGLTYDILIYPKQLPSAIELVAKFPKQRFVIDHLAKPYIRTKELTPWKQQMRTLASSPNVYCKISGLITEADWRSWRKEDFIPYLDVVFDAFGCNRLMFGSDWPVCLVAGTYDEVLSLTQMYTSKLSLQQQARIFGLNAVEFYGLET
jgi:L-fuconolactonase